MMCFLSALGGAVVGVGLLFGLFMIVNSLGDRFGQE